MQPFRLNSFWGMVPIMDERLLPAGAAAYSENARPTGGNLRGYRPDAQVHTLLSGTAKSVFRIPDDPGEDLSTTFANSTWMEFAGQYTDVLRTPVIGDQFERYYWAGPDITPKYNTRARIQAGDPAFDLGIPAPSTAPTIVVDGGTVTYTYEVTAGALPPGLSLDEATGVLDGIATTVGTYNFTVTVTDSVGNQGTLDYELEVVQSGLVRLAPTSLSNATVGVAYSKTFTVEGGGAAPFTLSLHAGSLPSGITFNATTGVLSGTPTLAGTWKFTLRAVDTNGLVGDQEYQLSVATTGRIVAPATLPNTQVAFSYFSAVACSGGTSPYTFSVVTGVLPPGLLLDSTTGAISGTTTTIGDYDFTIRATDSLSQTADRRYLISVTGKLLTLWPDNLVPCLKDEQYSQIVSASGGFSPYTYSISAGALPDGLALNPVTGEIAGKATVEDTYTFTVQVVDNTGTVATRAYTLTVGLMALNLIPVALPDAVQGASYLQTFAVDKLTIVTVTRAYLTTWVSEYGEEGPAGVPSAVTTGRVGGVWALTLTPPTSGEKANRNLAKTRVYRTITDATGNSTYFLVDEIDIDDVSFADDKSDATVSGQTQLQSTTWVAPPALEGLIAMPNGIFVGWKDKDIYFSEPYRPHAWPVQYVLSVDFPIVGLGVFGQTLVALTTGVPYTVTGIHPSQMSQWKSETREPCLSRSSIVSAPNGVTYASSNGLIFVTAGAVQNVTAAQIDREMWIKDVEPRTLISAYYKGGYLAMNGPRAGAGRGFYMGLNAVGFDNTAGQIQQVGFNWVTSTNNVQNVQVDPWTGEIFVIYDSGGSRRVMHFDPSTSDGMNTYTWRSALFQLPKKENLARAKVMFTVPAGIPTQSITADHSLNQTTLATGQYALLRVFADGTLVAVREIRTSGEQFSLPSGFKAETWQFEIIAKVIVHSLEAGSSLRSLAGV